MCVDFPVILYTVISRKCFALNLMHLGYNWRLLLQENGMKVLYNDFVLVVQWFTSVDTCRLLGVDKSVVLFTVLDVLHLILGC